MLGVHLVSTKQLYMADLKPSKPWLDAESLVIQWYSWFFSLRYAWNGLTILSECGFVTNTWFLVDFRFGLTTFGTSCSARNTLQTIQIWDPMGSYTTCFFYHHCSTSVLRTMGIAPRFVSFWAIFTKVFPPGMLEALTRLGSSLKRYFSDILDQKAAPIRPFRFTAAFFFCYAVLRGSSKVDPLRFVDSLVASPASRSFSFGTWPLECDEGQEESHRTPKISQWVVMFFRCLLIIPSPLTSSLGS